ncbi:MAG: FecR domain-containing protein [Pyrinomonadaceae bacterium]
MSRFSKAAACALVLASLFCAAVVTRAQNREKFVISAQAGGVNSVIGRVTVQSADRSQPELLTAQSDLKSGDMVDTGTTGRVEVLLNPGSYLRVAEGSRFALTDNALEHLKVSLLKGSAILEATGTDGVNTEIDISTPQHHLAIVKRGIYRVNVFADRTELLVLKGKAIVNNDLQNPVRGNQKIVLGAGPAEVTKLNKKEMDGFDSWSKDRAETLARANRRLPARDLNTFLASYDDRWTRDPFARPSGVWVFNRGAGCYTFLPFYFGWGSPYGGSYSSLLYGGCYHCGGYSGYDRRPGIVTNNPGGSGPGGNGPGVGTPGGSGPGSNPGRGGVEPRQPMTRDPDMVGPRGKNIEPSDPNRP